MNLMPKPLSGNEIRRRTVCRTHEPCAHCYSSVSGTIRSFLFAITIQKKNPITFINVLLCHANLPQLQQSCRCSICICFFLRRSGAVSDTTMVACSFSPCSQMFMTGSTYGDLRMWDLHMKLLHKENNAHDLGVTCCAFAPSILSSERHWLYLTTEKHNKGCRTLFHGLNITHDSGKDKQLKSMPLYVIAEPNARFCTS